MMSSSGISGRSAWQERRKRRMWSTGSLRRGPGFVRNPRRPILHCSPVLLQRGPCGQSMPHFQPLNLSEPSKKYTRLGHWSASSKPWTLQPRNRSPHSRCPRPPPASHYLPTPCHPNRACRTLCHPNRTRRSLLEVLQAHGVRERFALLDRKYRCPRCTRLSHCVVSPTLLCLI